MDFTGRITVFVYGTLMQGFPNEITISEFSHEVYSAKISDVELYDTGTFPAMVRGKHNYLGELIVFDSSVKSKEVFSHLDRLICGHIKDSENSLYVKEPVTVLVEYKENDNKVFENVETETYLWNQSCKMLQYVDPNEFSGYKEYAMKRKVGFKND